MSAAKKIDKAAAVEYQLALAAPEEVAFDEGGATTLTPARWVPEVANFTPVPLDGAWQVAYWPFPADEASVAAGTANVRWEEVRQPGKVFYYNPEQSPDSIPGWNRVTLEHLDPEDGAIIQRSVTVPDDWFGRRVLLRFEGIYPAGRIYWDGRPVAEQWSGLTPIEMDVTDLAKPGGTHTVAVRLYRTHPSVQLDMPRHALEFTGLCRPAFLHCAEEVHFADVHLFPTLDEDDTTGHFRGEGTLRNTGDREVRATVGIHLNDAAGRLVAEQPYTVMVPAGGEAKVALQLPGRRVRPWSAERPYLYHLAVRLRCAGQEAQQLDRRVGFRRFEMKDQRPLLNGRPVKFRGVNHLTFHPEGGLVTPEPWLRECLTGMKRANVNAIRTHFFGPRELVDLCDELGLYLLQELPIDWGHTYLFDPVHVGPVLHRLEACVRRDRSHPSVMVWSVGNENMPRTEVEAPVFNEHLRLFDAMVKRMDPHRPTMFPPPGPANKITGIFEARIGDIADTHYSFNLVREFNRTDVVTNPRTWVPTFETHTRQELVDAGWSGVWFSSEYGINNLLVDLLNAPYTAIIADLMEDPLSGKNSQQVFLDRLAREWGYMRDDPTCLGGAYFPWMAGGAGNPWGWTRWGEDADWGVVTGDLLPKPAYWALRVLFSPVRFQERISWQPGETAFRFTVHNAYNSIDLSECTLRTQMGGGPPYMGMMREWKDVPWEGAPGTTAAVTIPIWNPGTLQALQSGKPVVCRCTVLDPDGFRPIMADVLVIPERADLALDTEMPVGPDAA